MIVTISVIVVKNLTKISEKIVDNSQISALNGRTKQCAIYFYYFTSDTYAACASCMIGLRNVHIGLMSAIRKHVIDYHDAIDSDWFERCTHRTSICHTKTCD